MLVCVILLPETVQSETLCDHEWHVCIWVRYAGMRRGTWVEKRPLFQNDCMHLEVEATGTTVPSVLLPAWYCCVCLNVRTRTSWLSFCFSFMHTSNQRTSTLWAVEKLSHLHTWKSVQYCFFFFFYRHVPFSVGFFASERRPRPAWWPQTLREVKWNSQSSQLWKIPIVQNKMFDYVCVLLHRKMRTIPKNWSESNQQVTKMRYTAW